LSELFAGSGFFTQVCQKNFGSKTLSLSIRAAWSVAQRDICGERFEKIKATPRGDQGTRWQKTVASIHQLPLPGSESFTPRIGVLVEPVNHNIRLSRQTASVRNIWRSARIRQRNRIGRSA